MLIDWLLNYQTTMILKHDSFDTDFQWINFSSLVVESVIERGYWNMYSNHAKETSLCGI